MIGSFLQKIFVSARSLVPAGTIALFLLVGAVALPLPYVGAIAPSLALSAIFYWAIYRPDLLRPLTVFLLGIANDIIHFLPIGLSALMFVGAYQLALSQRRFFVGQIFFMLWTGFALVALISSAANWAVVSYYEDTLLPVRPVAMQYLMTVAFFPLPAWLLIRAQRSFLSQG